MITKQEIFYVHMATVSTIQTSEEININCCHILIINKRQKEFWKVGDAN